MIYINLHVQLKKKRNNLPNPTTSIENPISPLVQPDRLEELARLRQEAVRADSGSKGTWGRGWGCRDEENLL